jgi:hypothetical protein
MEYVVAASAVLISGCLFLVVRELHMIGCMIWELMDGDQKLLEK